jgi:hypothetical protein
MTPEQRQIIDVLMTYVEKRIIEQVNVVAQPHGCIATGIGPAAVNVVGDARAYSPCVYVSFPSGLSWDQIGQISTEITNRVRVSRVLMEIMSVAKD